LSRCQSCVESGKPRVAYGKRAFDEGKGLNVRQHDNGGVGDHNREDGYDSNTNDDDKNDDDDDDGDDDGEYIAI
jgi:hypothetical protein